MKMLLKSAGLALTIAAASVPSAVFAQAAAPTLTVDVQRLFADSAAAKSAQAQIKTKYEGNLNAAVTSYNTATTTLNTQVEAARKVQKPDGTVPPANQKAVGDAQNAYNAAGERLEGMQQEVNAVSRYVQSQILRGAGPVIEQVRNERRASMVLPKGSVLASDPAGDVTSVVIQRLDQSLKTVSITLPQQPAGAAPAAAAPAAAPPRGR
ncbi:MAG: outer rane family protein [Sphingomonas bacterium]|jgi:Skp family chaperone for outer membrane proteins|nr:outer rane family protein [Sphingomonas bacterium]MDB5716761.1 outer rane family protein [Sphingomonas bacterium]